ncbi:MAG: HD domain-containing protein [Actinobacteria bacterium]|nr:HD domain-containing protein [Actinomycetota bacterium]
MYQKRVPLAYKIIIPFALLNIVVASIAGPIARNWIAGKIEQAANQHMRDGALAVQDFFWEKEREVRLRSQAMADRKEVSAALAAGDPHRLLRELLPIKASFSVDSFAVADRNGRVLEGNGGLLNNQATISEWSLFKQGVVEMNSANLVETKRGLQLVGINPVRSAQGVIGVVLVGIDVNPILKEIKEDLHYDLALFLDGKLAASTLTNEQVRAINVDRAVGRVADADKDEITTTDDPGNPQRMILVPLKLHGEVIGSFVLLSSDIEVNAAKRDVVTNTILLNTLVVIVMGLIGYVISKRLSNPLEKVADAARAIASGNLSERVAVQSADEIGDLAEIFNKMADSLEQRAEELTHRINELSVLHDVSAAFGRTSNLEQLMDALIAPALELSKAEACYIGLANDGGIGLLPETWRALNHVDSEERAAVLRDLAVADLEKSSAPVMHDDPNLGHVACIPLRLGDSTNGIMAVSRKNPGFSRGEIRLLSTLGGEAAVAVEKVRLFNGLRESSVNTVKALANAVEAKDPYTRGHSEQVARYSMLLAGELGLSELQKQSLETAAYLHDIGKIGVSDDILVKPGTLSKEEQSAIQQHTLVGANILSAAPFPWPITPVVRHHHERYDGKGYPAGLSKGEIPLTSRILAIADAFDAMISDRPYRRARSVDEALAELQRCAGTQFDPYLIGLFVRAVKGKKEAVAGTPSASVDLRKRWVRSTVVKIGELLIEGYGELAGPRVTGSLEARLNEFMVNAGIDVLVAGGRLEIGFDDNLDFRQEIEVFREVLRTEVDLISSVTGRQVAEKLYRTAYDSLTDAERRVLDFYPLVPQFKQPTDRFGKQ